METREKIPRRGYISQEFEKLLQGKLGPLIEYVRSNSHLDLQIRDNYFNIYSDGGNAMRVSERGFFFDPWYFYEGKYQGREIRKTYIQAQAKEQKDLSQIYANYPSKELALQVIKEINDKTESLIAKAKANDFEGYFGIAIDQISNWPNNRGERKDQHNIACSNRSFSGLNNLVVIDIEYAVSTLKSYNEAKNTKGNPKVPKFDIIAVDKYGQLYAIELKRRMDSDKDGSPQDVAHHLEDFNNSIGKPVSECDFSQEMAGVLAIKQKLGILGKDIKIDTNLCPKFAIAFSGESESEKNNFKEKHPEIMFIDIEDVDNKKLLILK